MSLIREAQLQEFNSSGKIKNILKATNEASETAELFVAVASKVAQLASSIAGDVSMMSVYDNVGEFNAMEELAGEIEAKLEVFNDLKLIASIDKLSETLKVKKVKATSKKADIAKGLGL